jgi:zinc/manganese transport system substrate-binding protein
MRSRRGSRNSIQARRRTTPRAPGISTRAGDAAIKTWEAKAAPLKGVQVVIMHRDQVYLCHWLGLVEVASIEPKPGVPPTAAYLGSLVGKLTAAPPKMILLNAYNDPKAATWLSDRIHVPAVTLPFSVGGTP